MKINGYFTTSPSKCPYLSDRNWILEMVQVEELSKPEYGLLLQTGWRRFGKDVFRNRCPSCNECRSLRVLVDDFKPNRSQRRAAQRNRDIVIEVGEPFLSEELMNLYLQHHEDHSERLGWRNSSKFQARSLLESMDEPPLRAQQWLFYLDKRLCGVCYVDPLLDGYSIIYSFYDPALRNRSLGTWMILSIIEAAKSRKLPYTYLGYYVKDCRSLSYKANFSPAEILNSLGEWLPFCD